MAQKMIRPLEPTANLRRITIAALDATTGLPTTGIVPAVGDLKVSQLGITTPVETTAAGTLTALAGGYYHYTFTQTEINARGRNTVRMTKAGLVAAVFDAEIDQPNLYDFGQLQAAAGTAMTLAAGASAVSTDYVGMKVTINNRERYVVSYDGATKIAQVDSAFSTTPSASDVYYLEGSTGFQAITASAIAAAVWSALRNSTYPAGSFGNALQVIRDGTAQAGAASSITLDASASAINNFYNNETILIIGGTGAAQENQIAGYVGATKVATVQNAWLVQPDNTSVFLIMPQVSGAGGSGGLTATQTAQAVWNALRASYATAGTFGQGVASVQGGVTGGVTGNVAGSVASVVGSVGGNVLGSVAGSVNSVATGVTVATNSDKTGYALSPAGVDLVLDDAVLEPGGVFAWAGATPRVILGWIGALARNKLVQTPTLETVRDSTDSTNIATATVSDDGTTYTRTNWS